MLRAGAYRQGGEPETTPAWCAVSQSIERRFGRWTLQSDCVDDHRDRTGRTSTLIDALIERARLRRVDIRLNERVDQLDLDQGRTRGVVTTHERLAATAVVWTADPWQLPAAGLPRFRSRALRKRLRHLVPAQAPTVSHDLLPPADDWASGRVEETIALDAAGVPTVTLPTTGHRRHPAQRPRLAEPAPRSGGRGGVARFRELARPSPDPQRPRPPAARRTLVPGRQQPGGHRAVGCAGLVRGARADRLTLARPAPGARVE